VLSASPASDSTRMALVAISLLPLLALTRVVVPQNSIPSDLWELVVAGPVVAAAVLLVVVAGARQMLGAPRPLPSLRFWLVVASLGGFAFGLAWATQVRIEGSTGVVVVVAVFVGGAVDELVFRGVLQQSLEPVYGPNAFVVGAMLYTAMLLGDPPVAVALGALLGLIFGYVVARKNVLPAVAAAHGLVNVVWLVLAPNVF
jgi:membrane protease YdiL (CAAX protease family)